MGVGDDFVSTELGFAPVHLNHKTALGEPWLVESTTLREETSGLAFRYEKELQKKCQDNSLEKWGNLVYGMQVDSNWVQVGDHYLPIRVSKKGVSLKVLWRQDIAILPWQSSDHRKVRLCLLAPSGDYSVSGTFTGWGTSAENCEDRLPLKDLQIPDILSKELKGRQVYYIQLPVAELQDAQFKFRLHEKGWFTDSLRWEWEMNNRKVESGACFATVSNIFVSWGSPEATDDDMVDFLKVALFGQVQKALFGQVQKGFDNAVRVVEEVEHSVLHVTCVDPSGRQITQRMQFQSSITKALEYMFFHPEIWQLSPGLYVWVAMQEQKRTGMLRSLTFLEKLIGIFADWPVQLTQHPKLADHVHETAQKALLASCAGRVSSKEWLQAAIQILLRCKDPEKARRSWWPLVVEMAGRLDPDTESPDWGAIQLHPQLHPVHFPHFTLDLALRVALQPPASALEVWSSATRFLEHFQHLRDQQVDSVAVCLALDEALVRHSRSTSMSWTAVAVELQEFLGKLAEGSFTEQLQYSLKAILVQNWDRCSGRLNEIPACGQITQSLVLVAKAITDDPRRVYFVPFERGAAYHWLRLAAVIGSEHHVP